jgi:hypothetical protein
MKCDSVTTVTVSDDSSREESHQDENLKSIEDILNITSTNAMSGNISIHETIVATEKDDDNEADGNESFEFTYSQAHEEKWRADSFVQRAVIFNGINLTLQAVDCDEQDSVYSYALKIAKIVFDEVELQNGIFPLDGKPNKSKKRIALDTVKTDILKDAISAKFSLRFEPYDIELKWAEIRTNLNRKICNKASHVKTVSEQIKQTSRKPSKPRIQPIKIKFRFNMNNEPKCKL